MQPQQAIQQHKLSEAVTKSASRSRLTLPCYIAVD